MLPTLVFVHGWGQSTQTWHAQIDYFSERYEVLCLNLPGHGGAPDMPMNQWESTLAAQLPDVPHIIIAWSLGGMLALHLALRGSPKLRGLVLLATTPCFRMRPNWLYGCSDEVFDSFRKNLDEDAERLLGHFFALMLQGGDVGRRRYLDIVRQAVDRRNPATRAGLKSGLTLLETLDLRLLLNDMMLPTLVIHGTNDAVVPVDAGRFLARHIPHAAWHTLQAGHALHLTQAQALNEILEAWCLNNISTRTA